MAMPASASLTPVAAGAIEWGYVPFNEAEHLCVTVPDHPFTITTKDSKGRTLTVYFGNYNSPGDDGAPTFVDIQHIGATRQSAKGSGYSDGKAPAFEVIGFAPAAAGGDPFDTRHMEGSPSLICIPLDGEAHAVKVQPRRAKLNLSEDDLNALIVAATRGGDQDVSKELYDRLRAARDRVRKEVVA